MPPKDEYLRRTYGITAEEWEMLWEAQGKRCAVCGSKPRQPKVDHDHALGNAREAVRGLVCHFCNRAFAHVRESGEFAQRVADYLKDPPAQRLL